MSHTLSGRSAPAQAISGLQRCGRTTRETQCQPGHKGGKRLRQPRHSSRGHTASWPLPQQQPPEQCLGRRSLQLWAASSPSLPADDDFALSLPQASLQSIARSAHILLKFSRPHTLLGTLVSVNSVSLLALGAAPISQAALAGLLQALVAALLMNVCIVGINQLYDIDIDRVNKPYLPLASGELSFSGGVAITCTTGAASLALGLWSGSVPLLVTLAGSLLLGMAYSMDLPFLRWKQHPVAAAACILAVRAVLVQLGFFAHMKQVLGASTLLLTRPLVFATGFMLLFSIVIALFKDIPDVKGDVQAGVRTLSVRRGVPTVFWTCIALLELAYAGGVVSGVLYQVGWSRIATVLTHAGLGALLAVRAQQTDLTDSTALYSCYMFVWKLFYSEYLLLPIMR